MVKVKAKLRFYEAGFLRVPGDEFEMELDRARALGGSVEIMQDEENSADVNPSTAENPSDKQITAPPMDKQIKRAKGKK